MWRAAALCLALAPAAALADASIDLSAFGVVRVGEKAHVAVSVYRQGKVHLRLYRIDDPAAFFLAGRTPGAAQSKPNATVAGTVRALARVLPADLRAGPRAVFREDARALFAGASPDQVAKAREKAAQRAKAAAGPPPPRKWPLVAEWDEEIALGDYSWGHEDLGVPVPTDKPGVYDLEALTPDRVAEVPIVVSDLRFVVKRSLAGTLVWVTGRDGEPVRGASVRLFTARDSGEPAPAEREERAGKTDADGLFTTGAMKGEVLALVSAGGDFAPSRAWGWFGGEEGDDDGPARVFAFTDRPVYRPGHEVHLKAVARREGEHGWVLPPAGAELTVTWSNPRGDAVLTQTVKINDQGSALADLSLPAEAPLGPWSVQLEGGGFSGYASFRVEEYKKPEFAVKVTPDKAAYIVGDELHAKVEARYYFGEPVRNGRVTWFVYRAADVTPWWYDAEWAWFYGDDGEEYPGLDRGWQLLERGEGALETDGTYQVALKLPGFASDAVYKVEARVVDASRREIPGTARVKVARAELSLSVHPDGWGYAAGDTVRVTCSAKSAGGAPAAAKADLVLVRGGAALTHLDVEIPAGGEVVVPVKVTEAGDYELRLEASDAAGRQTDARSRFWVSGGTPWWTERTLAVKADKPSYKPGDTLNALVAAPPGAKAALVTVEGPRLYESKVVRLENGTARVPIALTADDAPNVSIAAAAPAGGQFYRSQLDVKLPPTDRFLTVTVKPDKDRYQPGEKIGVEVRVADDKGQPADAEVALALVDEAIFAIAPDTTPDVRAFWYARRPVRVNTSTSDDLYQYGYGVPFGRRARFDARDVKGRPKAPPPEQVRRDFKDTLLWLPTLRTGAKGVAYAEVTAPDNLTAFRITARAVTADTHVGQAVGSLLVRKDLIVRIEAPRVFRQRDEVQLATVVHNYLPAAQKIQLSLAAQGVTLRDAKPRELELQPNGEARVDWPLAVEAGGGEAVLTASARGADASDAMEIKVPVEGHGFEERVARVATLRGDAPWSESFTLPAGADVASARLDVSVAPSMAGVVYDAVDYLVDYPYGCVEQTMSRFLPDLYVASALQRMGGEIPERVAARVKELPRMVDAGVGRLVSFQHADGGWGWWTDDETNPFMTAYVVRGLTAARQNGYAVPDAVYTRGVAALQALVQDPTLAKCGGLGGERTSCDETTRLYMVGALAEKPGADPALVKQAFAARSATLNPQAKALLGVALLAAGDKPDAETLEGELVASAQKDDAGMHWKGKAWHYNWEDDEVQSTSAALRLFTRGGPRRADADEVARWLVQARRGNHWESTQDSAAAVLALTDYLVMDPPTSGGDVSVEVKVNGRGAAQGTFGKKDALSLSLAAHVSAPAVALGENRLEVARQGAGALLLSATLRYRTAAEDLTAADHGFTVRRAYYKLTPRRKGDGFVYDLAPLAGGAKLAAGDEVLVRTFVTPSRPGLEYAVIEDPLPAGFEVVKEDSGYAFDGLAARPKDWWFHREVHDDRIAYFAEWMPRKEIELRSVLRAQIPGSYHAMPARAELMYYPEVTGHSDEWRVEIAE